VLEPLVVRLGDETVSVTLVAAVPPEDEDEEEELDDELVPHDVARQDVPPPPPPHATKVAHAAAAASTFKYCNISTPAIQFNEQTKLQLLATQMPETSIARVRGCKMKEPSALVTKQPISLHAPSGTPLAHKL